MMDKKKKKDFTDYLLDEDFVLKAIKGEEAEYSEAGISKSDDASDNYLNALQILKSIRVLFSTGMQKKKEEIWQNILEKKVGSQMLHFFKVAASLVLIGGISLVIYFIAFRTNNLSVESIAASSETESFERSELIISGGTSLTLSSSMINISYSDNGKTIRINDSLIISQEAGSDRYNEIIVPYGKYFSLKLSDGTHIWINAGSRLIYPSAFGEKSREIFLQGEAYLEVAGANNWPFYVKTSNFNVEVSGTSFSVQADDKKNIFSTLLLEGAVTIYTQKSKNHRSEQYQLTPGNMAVLNVEDNNIVIEQVKYPESLIAWKNGYIIFNDEPLSSVLQRVSKFYNVDVEIINGFSSIKITGKLELKDDPERVLKGLAAVSKSELVKTSGKFVLR